jgi:hypothetical protein
VSVEKDTMTYGSGKWVAWLEAISGWVTDREVFLAMHK